MSLPPSKFIGQYIENEHAPHTLGTDIFVGLEPGSPPQVICVYDTKPRRDGKAMSGLSVKHPGIQIVIRTTDYEYGWSLISQLEAEFLAMNNYSISSGGDQVTIRNVSVLSGPFLAGLEEAKGAVKFTINLLLTI